MNSVYNFSAGPAALPESVLLKAQKELLNYNNTGMSVMELSHRGTVFSEILQSTTALLRVIMQVPDNYKILLVHGGASTQFAMIPMNFAPQKKANYIDTGVWSIKAIKEAQKLINVTVVASGKVSNY